MEVLIVLYLVAGIFTAWAMYQPSGHIHFEPTTAGEAIVTAAIWPLICFMMLILLVAALCEEAFGRKDNFDD